MDKKSLILVVDDDPNIRETVRDILLEKDYDVIEAKDGEEALQKLENITPELILLDVDMPKIDGLEFYKNLTETKEGSLMCPIIALTGRVVIEELFDEFGVDAYLTKPFDAERLINLIELTIRHASKKQSDIL